MSVTELQSAEDSAVTDCLTEKWSELDSNQDGSLDRAEFARFEPIMNANEEAKQHADEHSIEIQSAVPQILNSAILEVGVRSSREQSAIRWIVLQE